MALKEIKAVLFDLGETLLNFGQVSTTALFKEAARGTYDYLRSLDQPVGPFKWYSIKHLIALQTKIIISNVTGNDFDSLSLLRGIGERSGCDMTDQQWEQVNWLWYEPLRKKTLLEPNITQTLENLKSTGLKLGIVSNTFVNAISLDKDLKDEDLFDFFDMRIYSYQLPKRKPHKSIFLEAAKRIGIDPENIMFIGDRVDYDVIGAMKAGMTPVLKNAYTNKGKKLPSGVERIENISELPAIIEKHNSKILNVAT